MVMEEEEWSRDKEMCDEPVKDVWTELRFRGDGSGMQRTSVVWLGYLAPMYSS